MRKNITLFVCLHQPICDSWCNGIRRWQSRLCSEIAQTDSHRRTCKSLSLYFKIYMCMMKYYALFVWQLTSWQLWWIIFLWRRSVAELPEYRAMLDANVAKLTLTLRQSLELTLRSPLNRAQSRLKSVLLNKRYRYLGCYDCPTFQLTWVFARWNPIRYIWSTWKLPNTNWIEPTSFSCVSHQCFKMTQCGVRISHFFDLTNWFIIGKIW